MQYPQSPTTPFRLDGEVALITGGATGLGLGMARCMVASGAKVVLVGRREEELKNAAAALGSADIGRAAVYLSSPAAKFVTGVVLPVDDGVSIGF